MIKRGRCCQLQIPGTILQPRQHSRRRAADLHRELRSQVFSGNAARAVGSEQLSHCVILLVNVPS